MTTGEIPEMSFMYIHYILYTVYSLARPLSDWCAPDKSLLAQVTLPPLRDITSGAGACDFKLRGDVEVYKQGRGGWIWPGDFEYVITAVR
mgnify:CR=1 FL=1